jgi:hypothetical protein
VDRPEGILIFLTDKVDNKVLDAMLICSRTVPMPTEGALDYHDFEPERTNPRGAKKPGFVYKGRSLSYLIRQINPMG